MLEIRIKLKNEQADVIEVKETFAYLCEKFGDVALIDVAKIEAEQFSLFNFPEPPKNWKK